MPLISKDEPVRTSVVNVGFHILKLLDKKSDGKASLAEISGALKTQGITRYREITFALIFLHMADAIEFAAPYIYLRKSP